MKPNNSDLIADILAARRQANAVILSIPATPAMMRQQASQTPAEPQPAPTPISEADFRVLLQKLMPGINEAASLAIEAFRAKRLSWGSAVSLGTALVGIVSLAVREGAPLIEGQSARTLVILIFGVLFDTYLTGLLPIWVRPFSALIKASVIQGLESLYQSVIKKKTA